jgi:hypothetical protein
MIVEAKYLAGKVVKRSLPTITGRPGPDAPALKRLLLPQGELAQILDSEEGIRYLAAFELRAGGIRGNHYHKAKEEWIYVVQGRLNVAVQDIQTSARAAVPLAPGASSGFQRISPMHCSRSSPGKRSSSRRLVSTPKTSSSSPWSSVLALYRALVWSSAFRPLGAQRTR